MGSEGTNGNGNGRYDGDVPSARSPELPDKVRAQVIKLYQAGMTTAKITEQTGVARGTLYWILDQAGIEKNRTKRADVDVATLQQQILEQQLEIGRLLGRLEALEARFDKLSR